MGYIKPEEICGYNLDNEIVCTGCIDSEDFIDDLPIKDIITNDDVDKDDGIYFCDRCKERL
jgi:hypothetical protein